MRKKIFYLLAFLLLSMWVHHVWLRVGKPAMTDAVRKNHDKDFVPLTAGTTAYELHKGDGPLVVLVHGFSIPSAVWDNTFNALTEAGFTVLRYDLFGRGFSDRPDTKYNSDLFVTQLKELTEKLIPGRRFTLCGLSMGGAISVAFADKYPQKVEKLVLIDPAGFPMATPAAAKIVKVPLIGDYFGRVFARRAIEKGIADNFTTGTPPILMAATLQQTEYSGYADAIVSTIRHMNMTGMEEVYRRVGKSGKPVLLLWGRADKVVPFANAEKVRAAMPAAKFVELEKSGHIPTIDENAKTHRVILEFLADA
ncbi:MAG: alpha/beta hydrolase [Turneriella sp.]